MEINLVGLAKALIKMAVYATAFVVGGCNCSSLLNEHEAKQKIQNVLAEMIAKNERWGHIDNVKNQAEFKSIEKGNGTQDWDWYAVILFDTRCGYKQTYYATVSGCGAVEFSVQDSSECGG